MNIEEYLDKLGPIPSFLTKYLELKILKRLDKIGYFCGMDYASKDIYNFPLYISRFHHSLSTALLTWKFTCDKKATLAALFHDIATPCFSHVIDYMNGDYELQESTEAKTEEILLNDFELKKHLEKDKINLCDIKDFKKYSIVDNKRPKLCVDRVDGIILTSLGWTQVIDFDYIDNILKNMMLYQNEEKEWEIGFKNKEVAKKIIYLNDLINKECHSNYDTYMMLLLAHITKYAIEKEIITYSDLYVLNEEELMLIFKEYALEDVIFNNELKKFMTIKKTDIPVIKLPKIKNRFIKPIVAGERYE